MQTWPPGFLDKSQVDEESWHWDSHRIVYFEQTPMLRQASSPSPSLHRPQPKFEDGYQLNLSLIRLCASECRHRRTHIKKFNPF